MSLKSPFALLAAALLATGLSYWHFFKIRAEIEVVKFHDDGSVDFKFTNYGRTVYYYGFSESSSILEKAQLTYVNAKEPDDPGCSREVDIYILGQNIREVKRGDSVEFTVNVEEKCKWRACFELFKFKDGYERSYMKRRYFFLHPDRVVRNRNISAVVKSEIIEHAK